MRRPAAHAATDHPDLEVDVLIDCHTCTVRGPACGDCVVSVLLAPPRPVRDGGVELDQAEEAALAVLAGSGLVPPLRMTPQEASPEVGGRGPVRRRAG